VATKNNFIADVYCFLEDNFTSFDFISSSEKELLVLYVNEKSDFFEYLKYREFVVEILAYAGKINNNTLSLLEKAITSYNESILSYEDIIFEEILYEALFLYVKKHKDSLSEYEYFY
jgi:hypothetical protein